MESPGPARLGRPRRRTFCFTLEALRALKCRRSRRSRAHRRSGSDTDQAGQADGRADSQQHAYDFIARCSSSECCVSLGADRRVAGIEGDQGPQPDESDGLGPERPFETRLRWTLQHATDEPFIAERQTAERVFIAGVFGSMIPLSVQTGCLHGRSDSSASCSMGCGTTRFWVASQWPLANRLRTLTETAPKEEP